MPYRVEIKPPAEKALERIDNPFRRRIALAIDRLADAPRPPGCVKLRGADDAYRMRVGDYRIVYEVVDRIVTVYIVRIAHRREVYRGL
jgi:mRNA interferase RelE/StbE